MENSHLAIFDEIWPTTLYRDFGLIFEQLKKFVKKSSFDRYQLKISTQHKNMYTYQKM